MVPFCVDASGKPDNSGIRAQDVYKRQAAATTLRVARTATLNDWAAMLYYEGEFYDSISFPNLEIPVSYTHLDVYKRQG